MYKLSYSIEDGTLSFCDFTIYLAWRYPDDLELENTQEIDEEH